MKYGHEDQKTGIALHRDVYFEQFAEPGDKPRTNYFIKLHGDTILEGTDPKEMADQLMRINARLYMIADFFRRIAAPKGPRDVPSGDID